MSRYFFVLAGPDNETHDDQDGTALPAKTDAMAYANRIMRELKDAGGYDDPGWVLMIKDELGRTVASVPFAKVEQFN